MTRFALFRRIRWLQAECGWEKENLQPRKPARGLLADVQVKEWRPEPRDSDGKQQH